MELPIYPIIDDIMKLLIIIISAVIISKSLQKLLVEPAQKKFKDKTVFSHLKNIINIIVYLAAFFLILWTFNIDITAAVAGLGIGALVVGFGLKDIISNWVSGIIIIGEKTYMIDDVIKVGDLTGIVTDIGLRTTKLKTYDRNTVIIPNSIMVNEKIINLTSGRHLSISSISFLIDYTFDIEKAKKIIEDVLKKNSNVVVDSDKKREIRFSIKSREWKTEIETFFWIDNPQNEEFIKSAITESIKKEFEKNNILPPLPDTLRQISLGKK
jgi:MscS family membrane protein